MNIIVLNHNCLADCLHTYDYRTAPLEMTSVSDVPMTTTTEPETVSKATGGAKGLKSKQILSVREMVGSYLPEIRPRMTWTMISGEQPKKSVSS